MAPCKSRSRNFFDRFDGGPGVVGDRLQLADMRQAKVTGMPPERSRDHVADRLGECGRSLLRKVVANTPPDLAMLVASRESADRR